MNGYYEQQGVKGKQCSVLTGPEQTTTLSPWVFSLVKWEHDIFYVLKGLYGVLSNSRKRF